MGRSWARSRGWSQKGRPAPGGGARGALRPGGWAASYLSLVPRGIYEPPWRYPASELAIDASYHVGYGLGVAAAYRALAGAG
jgi:hypothetical protein